MATKTETQIANNRFFDWLSTPGMEKNAVDAINSYTRIKVREDGLWRRLMPFLTIGNTDLDRQYFTDKPFMVIDKETDNPPAMSIGFGGLPTNFYIKTARYAVAFCRLMTQQAYKDVDELRTYVMDVRQVFSDNMIKDMLAEEDNKGIAAVNTAMIGQGSTVPTSGAIQWQAIAGGVNRSNYKEARKIMPATLFRLMEHTTVINNITVREFEKFTRDEVGGDFSEKLFMQGWTEESFDRMNWLVTIKQNLIPNNAQYFFADPKFIGKSFMLEPTTLHLAKPMPWLIQYYAFETIGSSIGHTAGLARADYT
jgi:hypothetical protein